MGPKQPTNTASERVSPAAEAAGPGRAGAAEAGSEQHQQAHPPESAPLPPGQREAEQEEQRQDQEAVDALVDRNRRRAVRAADHAVVGQARDEDGEDGIGASEPRSAEDEQCQHQREQQLR